MLGDFGNLTALAAMCAVIAVVYMLILPYEQFFNPWFRWGTSVGINPDGSRKWWYKPLFECEKCMAGQIALWWYLVDCLEVHTGPIWFYLLGNTRWPIHFKFILPHGYDLVSHAYAVTAAILFALVLGKVYARHIDNK
jgi:hypothetical protein